MSDLCDDIVEILRPRFPDQHVLALNAAAGHIYGHLSKHFDDYADAIRASSDREKTVCWAAYYFDLSAIAVFDNELDALRHAVGSTMEVIELRAGDVMEQINERIRRAAQ